MLITASLGKTLQEQLQISQHMVKHPNNPDAWNYLGFSSRKSVRQRGSSQESTFNYPKHLGALNTMELHLTLKRPEKAKLLLAELKFTL